MSFPAIFHSPFGQNACISILNKASLTINGFEDLKSLIHLLPYADIALRAEPLDVYVFSLNKQIISITSQGNFHQSPCEQYPDGLAFA
jgi:hypothetical protein